MSTATVFARSLIRQLIELGVSQFVLSPGSRNSPLSIALYQAKSAGLIDLHVRIDERSAAFFALGIAKATHQYCAVICTSGTAAANYHPAVLEAYHSDTKLLIITADRPARLRRTGANQTTDQVDLYKVIKSHDVASAIDCSAILDSGPVHINCQFDEPLLPTEHESNQNWLSGISANSLVENRVSQQVLNLPQGNGLVIIGHDAGGIEIENVRQFVNTVGVPVIAENPADFPEAIPHASLFVNHPSIANNLAPDWCIVVGRTTLSRSVNALIGKSKHKIVIDPRALTIDDQRTAEMILSHIPKVHGQHTCEPYWIAIWERAALVAKELVAQVPEWSEANIAACLIHNFPSDTALFVGSSRPVRDIEAFATTNHPFPTYANRGLAGIDGNISTAMGLAVHHHHVIAVMGDLTFLHDVGALVNRPDVNLKIIVIDNNGGGIFSTLPQAGVPGFEEIFGTPHNNNLVRIASGFGVNAQEVKSISDLKHAIAHASQGICIYVLTDLDRGQSSEVLKNFSAEFAREFHASE